MFRMKPVFGWGYNTLNQNIGQFYRQIGSAAVVGALVTSHNTFLTILAEQGLIILCLYLLPAAWLMVRTVRNWRLVPEVGQWNRSMLLILWLAAMNYFVTSNFLDMRFFPFGIGLWWMILGLIANIIDPMLSTFILPGKVQNIDFTSDSNLPLYNQHKDFQRV
jgi:O-antigen ligase